MGAALVVGVERGAKRARIFDRQIPLCFLELCHWKWPAVLAAQHRINSPVLNSSQFAVAFSGSDGLAGLSQRVFEILQDEHTETVPAAIVLVLLTLLCDAPAEGKANCLLQVFDANTDNTMSHDEFRVLIQAMVAACGQMGLLLRRPGVGVVDRLALSMAVEIDADGDGVLSVKELEHWLDTSVVTGQFLDAVEGLSKASMLKRQGSLRRRASFGELTTDDETTRQTNAARAASIARAGLTPPDDIVDKVSSTANFTLWESRMLCKLYFGASGPQGLLDLARFSVLMGAIFPGLSGPKNNSRFAGLFHSFDLASRGSIDIFQFALGCSTLFRGDATARYSMMFDVIDLNGEQRCTPRKLATFLLDLDRGENAFFHATEFAADILRVIDRHFDGASVSRQAFAGALRRSALLRDCMIEAIIPGIHSGIPFLRPRWTTHATMSLKSLYAMWSQYMVAERVKYLSLTQFRAFMRHEFDVSDAAMPVVNRIFEVIDRDENDHVCWAELIGALNQAFGSLKERAKLYFTVCDMDGTGQVEVHELVRMFMLAQSENTLGKEAVHAEELMRLLDKDHGGSVDLEEFTRACEANPQLLSVFGNVFGAHKTRPATPADESVSAPEVIAAMDRIVRSVNRFIPHASFRKLKINNAISPEAILEYARITSTTEPTVQDRPGMPPLLTNFKVQITPTYCDPALTKTTTTEVDGVRQSLVQNHQVQKPTVLKLSRAGAAAVRRASQDGIDLHELAAHLATGEAPHVTPHRRSSVSKATPPTNGRRSSLVHQSSATPAQLQFSESSGAAGNGSAEQSEPVPSAAPTSDAVPESESEEPAGSPIALAASASTGSGIRLPAATESSPFTDPRVRTHVPPSLQKLLSMRKARTAAQGPNAKQEPSFMISMRARTASKSPDRPATAPAGGRTGALTSLKLLSGSKSRLSAAVMPLNVTPVPTARSRPSTANHSTATGYGGSSSHGPAGSAPPTARAFKTPRRYPTSPPTSPPRAAWAAPPVVVDMGFECIGSSVRMSKHTAVVNSGTVPPPPAIAMATKYRLSSGGPPLMTGSSWRPKY